MLRNHFRCCNGCGRPPRCPLEPRLSFPQLLVVLAVERFQVSLSPGIALSRPRSSRAQCLSRGSTSPLTCDKAPCPRLKTEQLWRALGEAELLVRLAQNFVVPWLPCPPTHCPHPPQAGSWERSPAKALHTDLHLTQRSVSWEYNWGQTISSSSCN